MKQSLLPSSSTFLQKVEVGALNESSKTWRVDFEANQIKGSATLLEAIEQAVFFMLRTDRYNYPIYTWNYGEELRQLIGKNKELTKVEGTRLIKECLLQDDRIKDVDNFRIKDIRSGLVFSFDVITIGGTLNIERGIIL